MYKNLILNLTRTKNENYPIRMETRVSVFQVEIVSKKLERVIKTVPFYKADSLDYTSILFENFLKQVEESKGIDSII